MRFETDLPAFLRLPTVAETPDLNPSQKLQLIAKAESGTLLTEQELRTIWTSTQTYEMATKLIAQTIVKRICAGE